MDYFAGLDISMEETHICVVDRADAFVDQFVDRSPVNGSIVVPSIPGNPAIFRAHCLYPSACLSLTISCST